MDRSELGSLPRLEELGGRIRGVCLHWTAGGKRVIAEHLRQYNLLLERAQDGLRWRVGVPLSRQVLPAVGRPSANSDHPLAATQGYAAHTRGLNSGRIGLAFCGMRGAVDYRRDGSEGRVEPGPDPITAEMVEEAARIVALLCWQYKLEVSEQTVYDHYEAHHRLGVPQRQGVWDCQWLPGLPGGLRRGSAMDSFRKRVQGLMEPPKLRDVRWPPREVANAEGS